MEFSRRSVAGGLVVVLLGLALVIAGCSGSGDGNDVGAGTGTVRVMLTDAPLSDVQEVWVQITRIEAVSSGHGVQVLVTDEQIPDEIELIELAGNPMLLGEPLIPAGRYTQVRLILNDAPGANYIVDSEDVKHDLKVPSGAQTGAKLVTGAFDIEQGETVTLLLDFDAAASVHQAGASGMWIMRPTIFASVVPGETLQFATIRGTVLDEDGAPLPAGTDEVLAVFVETPFGPISISQVDPTDGSFEIPSILAGSYQAYVAYADPDGWEPTSPPLNLIYDQDPLQYIDISLDPDQTLDLDIVVDLS